ncbi:hypothetical protein GN956_G20687 [Arapaima gigas]
MIILLTVIPWIALSLETGSLQTVPPVDHFVLEGGIVHLTAGEHPQLEFRRFAWKINSTAIVERSKGNTSEYLSSYKKLKMNFNPADLSLVISNLTVSEMGTYTASIDVDGREIVQSQYNLHVQKAVPKPILNLAVLHLNSTVGFCNVFVNCTVRDSWVSYTCAQVECIEVNQSTRGDVKITVTPENGTITCMGRNHVSNGTQSQPMCAEYHSPSRSTSVYPVIFPVVGLGAVVFIAILTSIIRRRHASRKHMITQMPQNDRPAEAETTYSVPRNPEAEPRRNDNAAKPETVYATLGLARNQVSQSRVPPRVEDPVSLYSVVRK